MKQITFFISPKENHDFQVLLMHCGRDKDEKMWVNGLREIFGSALVNYLLEHCGPMNPPLVHVISSEEQ